MTSLQRNFARRRHAFTMMEAVMATVIVAGLLVVTLNSVSASRGNMARAANHSRAQEYGLDLMAEILQQSYQPPASQSVARSAWTSVSQYSGFTESPLQTKTGAALP